MSTKGLYQRIRYDREVGWTKAAALYAAARALRLVTNAFPSDIQYFVFRAAGDTRAAVTDAPSAAAPLTGEAWA